MRYYSEITQKTYNTEKECLEAEFKVKEEKNREKIRQDRLVAQRKERAAEVDAARKTMVEAQKKYKEVLEAFIKDYKSYHYSSTDVSDIPTLFDLFNWF